MRESEAVGHCFSVIFGKFDDACLPFSPFFLQRGPEEIGVELKMTLVSDKRLFFRADEEYHRVLLGERECRCCEGCLSVDIVVLAGCVGNFFVAGHGCECSQKG